MRTSLQPLGDDASEVVAGIGRELFIVANSGKWFPGLAKWLSATKPATLIHYLSGEPERSCYGWVEGRSDPPSRALVTMLRSDEGWRILEYLMRGSEQPWWLETKKARQFTAQTRAVWEQCEMDV